MPPREITLENLFKEEEMEHLAGQRTIFGKLIAALKNNARISETYPLSMDINGVRYSFYGKQLGDNIKKLENEFNRRAAPQQYAG
jgi:hypothetical protein